MLTRKRLVGSLAALPCQSVVACLRKHMPQRLVADDLSAGHPPLYAWAGSFCLGAVRGGRGGGCCCLEESL